MTTLEDINFEALAEHIQSLGSIKDKDIINLIADLCKTGHQDSIKIIQILLSIGVLTEPVITAVQKRDDCIETTVFITPLRNIMF